MCILNPHSNELRWGIEKGGVLKSTRIIAVAHILVDYRDINPLVGLTFFPYAGEIG